MCWQCHSDIGQRRYCRILSRRKFSQRRRRTVNTTVTTVDWIFNAKNNYWDYGRVAAIIFVFVILQTFREIFISCFAKFPWNLRSTKPKFGRNLSIFAKHEIKIFNKQIYFAKQMSFEFKKCFKIFIFGTHCSSNLVGLWQFFTWGK